MRRLVFISLFMILLIVPLCGNQAVFAAPKERVHLTLDIYVHTDNSADVTATYQLPDSGSTWYDVTLPAGQSSQLELLTVSSGGEQLSSASNPVITANTYYHAPDAPAGELSFYAAALPAAEVTINYKLNDVFKLYQDVADWTLPFTAYELPSASSLTLTLHLTAPVSRDDFLIFVHDRISFELSYPDQATAEVVIDQAPANGFDVRTVLPASLFENERTNMLMKTTILAEENTRQTTLNGEQMKQFLLNNLLFIFLIIIWPLTAVLLLVAFILVKRKITTTDSGNGLQLLPTTLIPPADLYQCVDAGSQHAKVVAATLIDLMRKGYLRIQQKPQIASGLLGEKVKFLPLIVKTGELRNPAQLTSAESQILLTLFPEDKVNSTVSLTQLSHLLKQHRSALLKLLTPAPDADRHPVKYHGPLGKHIRHFAMVTVLIAACASPAVLMAIALLKHLLTLLPQTDEIIDDWKRFIDFLTRLKHSDARSPDILAHWEEYLVYTIGFGDFQTYIKWLPEILQAADKLPQWYWTEGEQQFNTATAPYFAKTISDLTNSIIDSLK